MYSRLLIFKNSALVNLAIPVQFVKPIIIIKFTSEGLAIAAIEIIRIKLGIEINISIILEIIESTGMFTLVARKGINVKALPIRENRYITMTRIIKLKRICIPIAKPDEERESANM